MCARAVCSGPSWSHPQSVWIRKISLSGYCIGSWRTCFPRTMTALPARQLFRTVTPLHIHSMLLLLMPGNMQESFRRDTLAAGGWISSCQLLGESAVWYDRSGAESSFLELAPLPEADFFFSPMPHCSRQLRSCPCKL